MDTHNTPKYQISRVIDEMKAINGVKACALVSKTGIVLGNYFEGGSTAASLVGVMCAAMVSSAEGVASIIHIDSPTVILARSQDATIIVMSAGETASLVAVLQDTDDEGAVCERLRTIAERIGSDS